MKALIPVAGIGTRLRPLTNKVPKVLINIAGKPILFHLIDTLMKSAGIESIIIVIGYLGNEIREAVNRYYAGKRVKFEYVEQKEMLGLGHAVYHGKGLAGDEPLLIALGDSIFEFDIDNVLASEYSAIGVEDVEDVSRFGIIESKNGFITRMIEKPSPEMTTSRSAISGIYFLKSGEKLFSAVEYLMKNNIRTKNEYQLTDALQKLVDDGEKMVSFNMHWIDCGKPETLLAANSYLLKREFENRKFTVPKSKINPPVFIGNNSVIENSTIGPFVTVADNVVIRNSTVVNSLVCEDSNVFDAELDEVLVGRGESISYYRKRIMKGDGTISPF